MADSSSSENRREKWTDRATEYAEDYGWQIVPLQANAKSSPQYSEDPVERQLNAFIPVEYPEEATADPEEIEQFGVQFPVALIGAVTGPESGLLAVEIMHREIDPAQRDRIDALAADAPRVLGTHREYVLFRYPEDEPDLPPQTKTGGAVLHGDESVIQVPWRYYQWSLDSRDELPPAPEDLIEVFDGADDEPSGPTTETSRSAGAVDQPRQLDASENDDPEPAQDEPGDEREFSTARSERQPRSGAASDRTPPVEAETLQIPWATRGECTVVTGHPKTAGKSTWVLNLAAHLVTGASFLNAESEQADVVLLTDFSATSFQRTLSSITPLDSEDRSHLHVVHPREIDDLDWEETLSRTYRQADEMDADVIVVDSLDHYVRLKGGGDPTRNEDVVRALTTDAPTESAVIAVKSVGVAASAPLSESIAGLNLLGVAADLIVRLENVSSEAFPTLRRVRCVGRSNPTPNTYYCALREGQYDRVPANEVSEVEKRRQLER